ncbi:gamma-glutamyltransferase family protein [Solicola gregarius]|uniref:Gamma-glutamyltransferase family protein n=1 Tax=Solicola gregarius TaxID=2908642 RepID=A0AA46TJF8_9ACTN|nr:gamma-glutamyltransferase family protein [Solicola gregarius]UYM06215.1 gamma-glutamyltransferase family protein [Solicola gregarius]
MTDFTTRPELAGTFGMAASTHWLSSQTAMSVLERGGNAFDAVVAGGFVLQVVEPHQNGPGGDLPLLFSRVGDERPTVLCAQGPAPEAATPQAYRDLGLDLVPGSGQLAAVVPGATPGWLTLLRDHGTWELSDVLAYAIGYASNGYPLTAKVAAGIARVEQLFADEWTTSATVYLRGGRAPHAGALFTNPALAGTYERLVRAAVGSTRESRIASALTAWSDGFVAEAVDAWARTAWLDSTGTKHSGLITGADLARWRPAYEAPVGIEFGSHTVYKTGPWGQGPVLLQQLALLDGLDIRPGTPDFVHAVVEAAKLAFADREAWYGDVADVPLDALLSPAYNDGRRGLIGDEASLDLRPGAPGGRIPVLPEIIDRDTSVRPPVDATTGEPIAADGGSGRGDTVHLDVVDRWGTMISATPSGGWLHASPVIPDLGFGLGTRLQMAWLEEGLPNSLAPGKRPRTTLSPTMVSRDCEAVLAYGSPGGDQQDQWQLVFLLNHLLGGMNLQEAIDAPMFHTTHFPGSFYPRDAYPGQVVAEERLGAEVVAELESRGHRMSVAGAWELGRLSAVARDPRTGQVRAAANPRGMQGYAVGR